MKSNKELSATNKKLHAENKMLQLQLLEVKKFFLPAKTKNIDALVRTDKNRLKIFTENSADKTYRILVEKMHEGAVTLDKKGTILYSNLHFSEMVNLPLSKITGKNFLHFIGLSSTEEVDVLVKQGWQTAIKGEAGLRAKGNKITPVLLSVNTFLLDSSLVLSIIISDLSQQKKTQEQLKQSAVRLQKLIAELETSNKDLVSLTYISNHHLQEPLRKIQTIVSYILLKEKQNLSETGKDYFERLTNAARRMQELIKDLIVYSGIGIGDQAFEQTDLNLIINEACKEHYQGINDTKTLLTTADLGRISIIPLQFRQLFSNLISNSLKFSQFGEITHIKIRSRILRGSKIKNINLLPEGDYCHIIYADNGMGFDPRYNRLIFEVFQHLHSPGDYAGTGMGLAICRKIVENHKGIITATGKPNKGARFDIYIPVSNADV